MIIWSSISQDFAYFYWNGSDWRDLRQKNQIFPDICTGKNVKNVKNVKKWSCWSSISQDSAYFQRDGSDWRDSIQNIQFFPDICPGKDVKNVKNVKKCSFENQCSKILHIFTEIAQIEESWDKIFRFFLIFVHEKM